MFKALVKTYEKTTKERLNCITKAKADIGI